MRKFQDLWMDHFISGHHVRRRKPMENPVAVRLKGGRRRLLCCKLRLNSSYIAPLMSQRLISQSSLAVNVQSHLNRTRRRLLTTRFTSRLSLVEPDDSKLTPLSPTNQTTRVRTELSVNS